MTPNELEMFKIKNSNMHVTYTPRPKFSSLFEIWPNFGKSALNDPKMTLTGSTSKAPICILWCFLLLALGSRGIFLNTPHRVGRFVVDARYARRRVVSSVSGRREPSDGFCARRDE